MRELRPGRLNHQAAELTWKLGAIGRTADGKPTNWAAVHPQLYNLCYMLVNPDPLEAINVQFDYKIGPEGHLIQTQIDDNERRLSLWKEDLRWYGLMMDELARG